MHQLGWLALDERASRSCHHCATASLPPPPSHPPHEEAVKHVAATRNPLCSTPTHRHPPHEEAAKDAAVHVAVLGLAHKHV